MKIFDRLKSYRWNEQIKKWIPILIILIFNVVFFLKYKVYSAGYHLIDDHEILRIETDIKNFGFWATMVQWLRNDLQIRYRPVYFIIRVLEAGVFGHHFWMWHLEKALEFVVVMCMALKIIKQYTGDLLAYFVMMIILFWGEQSEVLWRLGPQELIGLMLLFITFNRLLCYCNDRSNINRIFLIIDTLLLSGIKESYLLLLPIGILITYLVATRQYESISEQENFKKYIKEYAWFIIFDIVVFLVSIYVICFRIGTTQIGYAGVDRGLSLSEWIVAILDMLDEQLLKYIILSAIALLVFVIPAIIHKFRSIQYNNQNIIKTVIVYIMIDGYFLISQLVLYAKSGMFYRYLLPCVMVFAVFFCIQIPLFSEGIAWIKRTYPIMLSIVVVVIVMSFGNISNPACSYISEGQDLTELFSYINENYDKSTKIIVSCDYEKDIAFATYLEEMYDFDNVYCSSCSPENNSVFNRNRMESIMFSEGEVFIGYKDALEEVIASYDTGLEGHSEKIKRDGMVILNRTY